METTTPDGAADKLAVIRELCMSRMVEAVDGGWTDADTLWPSEILAIIDDQANRS